MRNVYVNKECIEEVYRYIGMNKAETWSWEVESGKICINKAMDMNDAFRINSCWGIADV